MAEKLNYNDFIGRANNLLGILQRTIHIQADGGDPENTSQFHDAEEALFDLISLNRPFWDEYVKEKAENKFIQNLQLPF